MKRVTHEPGYVLHHYDWSESSVIVEAFTRARPRGAGRQGRQAAVVQLSPGAGLAFAAACAELGRRCGSFESAEWGGGQVMPTGDALLSGYYANELLMRLLAREDAHPQRLFDAYAALVHVLASHEAEPWLPPRCALSSCCCCAGPATCPRSTRRHSPSPP